MAELLRMQNITMRYPNGVLANDHVNFSLNEGEIHAIAGENGAGKSTIMKILYGAQAATSGEIYFRGEKVQITSPKVANALGIGMVYQHFMLVNEFTVYENIFLGIEEVNKAGVLNNELIYVIQAIIIIIFGAKTFISMVKKRRGGSDT